MGDEYIYICDDDNGKCIKPKQNYSNKYSGKLRGYRSNSYGCLSTDYDKM